MGIGESADYYFTKGEALLLKPYLGRGLIVGYNEGVSAAVYFVMGRSPSSQARVLEQKDNVVYTKPTDAKVLAKGNPELLLYNASMFLDDLLVVSNGRQTDTVFSEQLTRTSGVLDNFKHSLSQWSYEPDVPNNTPRIAGVIKGDEAYVGMVKCVNGAPLMDYREVPLKGRFLGVTTYNGVDANPLVSGDFFALNLLTVPAHVHPLAYNPDDSLKELDESFTAKMLGDFIWSMLNHDYRVSLASIVVKRDNFVNPLACFAPLTSLVDNPTPTIISKNHLDIHIINKSE